MAIPALLLKGLAIGGGAALGSQSANMGAALTNPAQRALSYQSNINAPNLLISPDVAFAQFVQGHISQSDLESVLLSHGIVLDLTGQSVHRRTWAQMTNHIKRVPSVEEVLIGLKREIEYEQGRVITDDDVTSVMRQVLIADSKWWSYLRNIPHPIPLGMLMEAWIREFVSLDEMGKQLKALGFNHGPDRDTIRKLSFGLPGPADLIRFAVREAWDEDVVRQFGYDAEIENTGGYRRFMELQGWNYNPQDVFPNIPDNMNIPWPILYWRSHWTPMSPHQGYEALHRLRPNRVSRFTEIPGLRPFTLDDMRKLLKIHDFPPPMRDWLAAISYRPITRVDIRRMFRVGTIDNENELVERYMDLGYNERDARDLADFTIKSETESIQRKSRTAVVNAILKSQEIGLLDNLESARRLRLLGVDIESSRVMTETVEIKVNNSLALEALRTCKKLFLKGEIDGAELRVRLSEIGINDSRIAQYIRKWKLQCISKGKEVTGGQIRQSYLHGLITPQEALTRLQNIGYSESDSANIIAIYERDREQQLLRMRERNARTEKARRSAQLAQLREERRNRNRIIADLNRSATKTQILRFYRHGFMDRKETLDALVARGIDFMDADKFVMEVDIQTGRASTNGQKET